MPFLSRLFARTSPRPDQDDASDASTNVPTDLIALDLSGQHTEATALEQEPLQVLLSRRRMPDEQSDLTSLDLGPDSDPSTKE
jgi:hypothetical protein